jgi:hypothetical protein
MGEASLPAMLFGGERDINPSPSTGEVGSPAMLVGGERVEA